MKTKHARLIRIGINARCMPYTSLDIPKGRHGTGIDYWRLIDHQLARTMARSPLTERAYRRTRPWVSRRLGAR